MKEKNIFNDETSAFVKEVIAMQGALTLPFSDELMDIEIYEYKDSRGFGAKISYL
ncbi:hypothetical protein ACQKMI_11155 [Lysinibacillus sp. NPDC097214]|uniref:hypothetical protein n=1 Tax=Lysinibacillus sp. NPDC097214 TaxID=3390584 RepID=UPI003D02D843